jgi:hypothetical protein
MNEITKSVYSNKGINNLQFRYRFADYKRKDLSYVALIIIYRLLDGSKAQNKLRDELRGKDFYRALKELYGAKLIDRLKKSKVCAFHSSGRGIYRTPNIWALSDKGRQWLEDYCRELEERIEAQRHGY